MTYLSDLTLSRIAEVSTNLSNLHDENFQRNKALAIQLAQNNGLALRDSLSPWSKDADVVRNAILNHPFAIRFAPDFQDNDSLAYLSVIQNGVTRFWLSPRLKQDQTIKELAQRTLPLQYSGNPRQDRKRFFLANIEFSSLYEYVIGSIQNRFTSPSPHFVLLEDRQYSFKEEKNTTRFIRDSHVTLFEGGHLLPYPIQNLDDNLLNAILPPSAHHFFFKGLYGKGFAEYNVYQAMVTAYDYGIPFQRGRTCIEGGNCFLFLSNGQRKAIIGEISLYTSMIALQQQGYFNEISLKTLHSPSMHAYRIARNLNIYEKMESATEKEKTPTSSILPPCSSILEKPATRHHNIDPITLQKYEKILNYYKELTIPVSKEDQTLFSDQARKIEAQLQLTKNYISQELKIPVENIVFIPQNAIQFGKVFITLEGEIVIQDNTYGFGISIQNGKPKIDKSYCLLSHNPHQVIIGEISLYLCMIALQQLGYFNEISLENIHQPSSHAYRIARNLNSYEKMKETTLEEKTSKEFLLPLFPYLSELPTEINPKFDLINMQKWERILQYYQQITTPISIEDQLFFQHQARKIETQLQLTKQYISEELKVPIENIAFVPQTAFHLDMEMFVTPQGEICCHDDIKVLEFLSELKRDTFLSQKEQELLKLYYQTAQRKALSFHAIRKMRADILKAHHLVTHYLPAVLKPSSKNQFHHVLNYCNGIFFKEGQVFKSNTISQSSFLAWREHHFSFLTTGPSSEEEFVFHNRFIEIFTKKFPQFYLDDVPGMSEFISRHKGGVHCLTFEDSLVMD